jgi:hypothetical protein
MGYRLDVNTVTAAEFCVVGKIEMELKMKEKALRKRKFSRA